MASYIAPVVLVLVFVVIVPLPLVANAQSYRNLTTGSAIMAGDPSTNLLSSSGEFAFGFQTMGSSGFLLAVWFAKISEQTVIWSANGDSLVPKGSKLRLTDDNRLSLDNPSGGEKTVAEQPGSKFAYASMLNTGNLVVMSPLGDVVWETFDHPTDTMLPTQKLGMGSQLVARYSQTNYSDGRFMLAMQGDGNLVLYTLAYPLNSINKAYWATNSVGSGLELVFNQSGQVYLTTSNGTIEIQSNNFSTDGFYQRAVLDSHGIFSQYVYPKSTIPGWSNNWSKVSEPVPPNICTSIAQDVGSGVCGFNSYCTIGDDQSPRCDCPSGYVWLDPDDTVKGCKQDFQPQSCNKTNPEGDKFTFKEMINIDWPLSDYEKYNGQTENWCRQDCLSDCFCAVAIYRDSTCWKKKVPLSNGRTNIAMNGKALVKVRIGDSPFGFGENKQKNKIPLHVVIVGSVLSGGSVCLNLLLVIVTLLTCRRLRSKKADSEQQPVPIEEAGGLRHFKYHEIQEATNGFKEELGRGAFGTVYKGFVTSFLGHGGHVVAVKVLHRLTEKGDIEFKREMRAISQTNHKNLVKLLGYCNDDQHRILIYEYMSNSCLANLLFEDSRPNWYKRIDIAEGVARGLSYLHEECSRHIIHCDIKPQNVLLDDGMVAKISDFGLAKLLVADQTRTLTDVRGTKGYVAPEWFRNMPISAKVDVYSFGIMLLELICCRKNYEPETEDEPEMILANWVWDCYHEGNLDPLVEDDDEALGDKRRVERLVRTALWCIQEDPSLRPTMKKVTLMLEGAVSVPVPPEPCSFLSSV
ncbi:hypothetical protein MLD38_009485 [Melastoma candidum]|uniref:Uncharacterized protein n=2 Tax=Melastoma candidum TaxID=119954 RepID=A0ACB9S676_9MYRT|nr:hypothetical protein MLD38_009485 [Melastoma candidum]